MRSSHDRASFSAALALASQGPVAVTGEVAARLVRALGDADPEVRFHAARILRRIGPTHIVVGTLVERVLTTNEEAPAIVEPFSRLGGPGAAWELVEFLGDSYHLVHLPAVRSFLPPLAEAKWRRIPMSGEDWFEKRYSLNLWRRRITRIVWNLWPPTVSVTDELFRVLCVSLRGPQGVRDEAVDVLGKIGSAAGTDEVLSWALSSLKHFGSEEQLEAAILVGRLGNSACNEEIIRALTDCLQHEDSGLRRSAADALGQIMPTGVTFKATESRAVLSDHVSFEVWPAEGWAPDLATAHSYASRLIRSAAFLGDHASDVIRSREGISDLIESLWCSEKPKRVAAAFTIARISPPATASEFLQLLDVVIVSVSPRLAATEGAVSGLLELLRDPDQVNRLEALRALSRLGKSSASQQVVTGWLEILTDSDSTSWDRAEAAKALGELGPSLATNNVVDGLVSLLGDPEGLVSTAAVEALREIGVGAATPETVSRLLDLLKDSDSLVRSAAAKALRKLGPVMTDPRAAEKRVMASLSQMDSQMRVQVLLAFGSVFPVILQNRQATSDLVNGLRGVPDDIRAIGTLAPAGTVELSSAILKILRKTPTSHRGSVRALCEILVKLQPSAMTGRIFSKLTEMLYTFNADLAVDSLSDAMTLGVRVFARRPRTYGYRFMHKLRRRVFPKKVRLRWVADLGRATLTDTSKGH